MVRSFLAAEGIPYATGLRRARQLRRRRQSAEDHVHPPRADGGEGRHPNPERARSLPEVGERNASLVVMRRGATDGARQCRRSRRRQRRRSRRTSRPPFRRISSRRRRSIASHGSPTIRGGATSTRPRRRTSSRSSSPTSLDDDGVVLSDLEISDDGSTVTFLRGGVPNTARMDRRAEQRSEWRRERGVGGKDEWNGRVASRTGHRAGALAPTGGRSPSRATARSISYRVTKTPADSVGTRAEAARSPVGPQRSAALVAGRVQARVHQRARQSLVRRRATT